MSVLRARAALALAAVFVGWPGTVLAQRVVVEAFGGPQSARLRAGLVASLQEAGLEIISESELRAAAREAGLVRQPRGPALGAIAERLGIVAVVDGRVRRVRRAWSLVVTVRSAVDGEIVGSATWTGRTVAALGAVRRNGYARLEEHLRAVSPDSTRPSRGTHVARGTGGATGRAPGTTTSSLQQETARRTSAAATGAGAGTQQPTDRPWYAVGQDDWYRRDDEFDETAEDDGAEETETDRLEFLRIALGAGSVHRNMQAIALVRNGYSDATRRDSDLPAEEILQEPRGYRSAAIGHLEAGVRLELYPGAVGDDQPAPWFGAIAEYRRSLFLSSTGCRARLSPEDPCTPEDVIRIPTNQSELFLGGRLRYRTRGARPTELFADVGWGNFTFDLEARALAELERSAVIPPLDYSYVHLGAGVRHTVVPRYLQLGAHAAYRLGLGIGLLAKQVWGVLSSMTSAYELGIEASSEASYLTEGAFLGLSVQYFVFTTTYRGQTACFDTTMSCNEATDPWEPWPHAPGMENEVEGGIRAPVDDAYVRVAIAVGMAFR
ncbi:MAG: hypothetical protein NZ898_08245 [Myxococcota bacterium]|nr:hypothetical protein [Myxococcota bacterium]MDW8361384.1 hypothetical protein [Myxococcales bacterium]